MKIFLRPRYNFSLIRESCKISISRKRDIFKIKTIFYSYITYILFLKEIELNTLNGYMT